MARATVFHWRDVPTRQVHKGWSTNPWDTCFLHCTLCSLHEEKGWVFSLADVASHLEFARPIELTANLNLNTQLNKTSCRDEDVLLTWDPFEEWLQEKERLQVCPATSSNSPRLLKLQNITCLSYTGHCGGTGTEVVSASVADTSVKTLCAHLKSVSSGCRLSLHSHRGCRYTIGPVGNPCLSRVASGGLEIRQDT